MIAAENLYNCKWTYAINCLCYIIWHIIMVDELDCMSRSQSIV